MYFRTAYSTDTPIESSTSIRIALSNEVPSPPEIGSSTPNAFWICLRSEIILPPSQNFRFSPQSDAYMAQYPCHLIVKLVEFDRQASVSHPMTGMCFRFHRYSQLPRYLVFPMFFAPLRLTDSADERSGIIVAETLPCQISRTYGMDSSHNCIQNSKLNRRLACRHLIFHSYGKTSYELRCR